MSDRYLQNVAKHLPRNTASYPSLHLDKSHFGSSAFLLQPTANKNAGALVVASKETGIEANVDRTKCVVMR